jgi:serine/threonine-protein kinase
MLWTIACALGACSNSKCEHMSSSGETSCPSASGDDGGAGEGGGGAGGSGGGGAGGSGGGGAGGSGGSPSGGSGGAGGMGGSGGSSVATGACGNAEGQIFPPEAPWNRVIEDAPLAADSQAIIDYLVANHDTDARFQVDFSITVLEADESTPKESFTPSDEFYEPDCDPAPVPIVAGGAIEGEEGYACESDGDCHLIVRAAHECRLYEMWRANRADEFSGGCLALWDIDRVYPETGRGDFCTSADAAGLPIAPLLFSAVEIEAGAIEHAIRFILPNDRIRELMFVRPGTHSTRATSAPDDAPPYAARLRLKADADLSGLNEAARVVARALQRYGMILADAGNLTFTAKSDRFDENTWQEVGFGPHDLKGLAWADFEVVDGGAPIDWESGSCEREPIED